MTCPRCKCPECARAELNAVLSRRVSRETDPPHVRELVEKINARILAQAAEQSAWWDTVEEGGR